MKHIPKGGANKESKLGSSWLMFLSLGSAVVTAAELGIANRKSGILTAGFLASPLTDVVDISLLVVAVFLTNAAVMSIPLHLALWGADWRKWSGPRVLTCGLFFAVSPIITVDTFWYQLTKYFGDSVNFFLLRTIGGGSLSEMLAQAWSHLVWLGLGIALCFLLISAAVHCCWRWFPVPNRPTGTGKRPGVLFTCWLIAGALVMVAVTARKNEKLNISLSKFPVTYATREVLNFLTDWDRDGSGIFGFPADPNFWDARIYPYAPDLPGNGVNENGIMEDFPAEAVPERVGAPEVPVFKRRPNLVLFVLESFRADLIFQKVHGKEITPNLNRLAAAGAAARWAFCHNGFTVGALKALFLGNPLRPSAPGSLLDDFKSNGYQTACFSGQNESFGGIAKTVGLERADHFYDARRDVDRRSSLFITPGSLTVPGEVVLERLSSFIKERQSDPRPLFLYINLQDTHFPYQHYAMRPLLTKSPLPRSKISPKQRERLVETYLNAVANVDAIVGEIMSRLEESLEGELALVLIADHGESLFDDDFLGHGHHLTDSQMRIPLIVKGFPARIEEPIGQDEIRAMIHQALSVPPGPERRPERIGIKGKKVFQYLGEVSRPSQISWAGQNERWTVDLRHFLERQNTGPWRELGATPDEGNFRELVHYWEALQLRHLGLD